MQPAYVYNARVHKSSPFLLGFFSYRKYVIFRFLSLLLRKKYNALF